MPKMLQAQDWHVLYKKLPNAVYIRAFYIGKFKQISYNESAKNRQKTQNERHKFRSFRAVKKS